MWSTIENAFGRLFAVSGGVLLLFGRSVADVRICRRDLGRLLGQMNAIGVHTFPLAVMIGLFTGMIFALNMGLPLRDYGAQNNIGGILGVALVRELAPVFTAFILAARVGAAITAELGTMAVSDEIDSLRVLGIRPTRYLATPRIVASLVMNPILTTYSCAAGMLGGALLAHTYLGVGPSTYWDHLFRVMDLKEINTGLIKALVFGGLYSSICVYYGLTTTGGAQGVGRSTTRAVVASLTSILVADFLLTRALFG
jgi:phospholipid/cholesterol/gamma-HCH transport system permease protein